MAMSWLRKLLTTKSKSSRGGSLRKRSRGKFRSQFWVERLEDRSVPTATAWIGGTSTSFSTPSNWSAGVPGMGDDATSNPGAPNDPILTGVTKVHSLTIAVGGMLDLAGNNLTINGGAFSNDGTVKLQGVENVTGLTQDVDSGTWAYTGRGTSTPLNI